MTDVLIIGAGPAGLLLACELRLAAVAATVIERAPERPDFCRGFNLNARSLDLLARRGRAETEGWLGEIEGIDLTLEYLRDKRKRAERTTTFIGMPVIK